MHKASGPQDAGLARAIRLPQATALVVGTIIGASIFVQPSEVTRHVPSVGGTALAWLLAGLLTFCGSLVIAELAAIYRGSGGVYVYLRELFSPLVGFLWGWAMFWVMHSGIIAAVAVVFARYLAYFVPVGDTGVKLVAIGVIFTVTCVNYFGVRQGSALQTAFTVAKVVAILAIVTLGFALGPAEGASIPAAVAGAPRAPLPGGPMDFLLALGAGLFAFGGWHMVTYTAGETVAPERTIPKSLLIGVTVVTACYIALNTVYFYLLPVETVIATDRVAAEAADAVFGGGGGAIMAALVVMSTFGALVGIVLAGPRVYYAMARDGLLFRWAGAVHARHRTPHRALLLQAGWASVLVLTGSYRALFTRVVNTEWLFFGLLAIGFILLRRREPERRLFASWAFPWIPIVFAVASFAVVAGAMYAQPVDCAIGLGFVLAGVPVYAIRARSKRGSRADGAGPRHTEGSRAAGGASGLAAADTPPVSVKGATTEETAAPRSGVNAHERTDMLVIDVHSHFAPPRFVDALRSGASSFELTEDEAGNPVILSPGDYNVLTRGYREADYRATVLDRHGVDKQVLSLTAPGTLLEEPDRGVELARMINDGLAHAVASGEGRYLALGHLPLHVPEACPEELERCVTELGLPGVMLFSNANGVSLANDRYLPTYEAADRLGAVLLIHPTYPVGVEAMEPYMLMPLVGFVMDTTLASAHLVFAGIPDRFPRIRWVLGHLGGAVPYLAERFDRGWEAFPECREQLARPPSEVLRSFYYDTVNFDPANLRLAMEFAGVRQLLAGSDYPHMIGHLDRMISSIKSIGLTPDEEAMVFGGNAANLFGVA